MYYQLFLLLLLVPQCQLYSSELGKYETSTYYGPNILMFSDHRTLYFGDTFTLVCTVSLSRLATAQYLCTEFIIEKNTIVYGNICCYNKSQRTWEGASNVSCETRFFGGSWTTSITLNASEDTIKPLAYNPKPQFQDKIWHRCRSYWYAKSHPKVPVQAPWKIPPITWTHRFYVSSRKTVIPMANIENQAISLEIKINQNNHTAELVCRSKSTERFLTLRAHGKQIEESQCGSGTWHYFRGSCYKFLETFFSMPSAHQYCALHNGWVTTIKSKEEQRFIANDLMYDMYYEFWIWVGLTMAPDGSMMWADGTQYDKESDWRIWHEPLSQAVPERALLCFMMDSRVWRYVDCRDGFDPAVVCQRPPKDAKKAQELYDETPRLVPVTIYTDEETHLYSRKTTEGTTKKWSIKFGLSHNNTVYTCNDGGRIVLGKTEARAQLVFDSNFVQKQQPSNIPDKRPNKTPTNSKPKAEQVPKCTENLCNNGGCVELKGGGISCVCDSGFTGDLCRNRFDACSSNPCKNGATCTATGHGFHCLCNPSNRKEGHLCHLDPARPTCRGEKECTDMLSGPFYGTLKKHQGASYPEEFYGCLSSPCVNLATCHDLPDGFGWICVCVPGFTGERCETTVRKLKEQSECCTEFADGDYLCNNEVLKSGENCPIDIDTSVCFPNPCQHGTCTPRERGRFQCECSTDWAGETCGDRISQCSKPEFTCNGNGDCYNLAEGGAACACFLGWTGSDCEHKIVAKRLPDIKPDMTELVEVEAEEEEPDVCSSNPCSSKGICRSHGSSYGCNCADGWFGVTCQKTLEKCTAEVCGAHGKCLNLFTSGTECLCDDGWTASDCSIQVDYCHSQPCMNGAACHNAEDGAECSCLDGWTGDTCGDVKELLKTMKPKSGVYSIQYTSKKTDSADINMTLTYKDNLVGTMKIISEECTPQLLSNQKSLSLLERFRKSITKDINEVQIQETRICKGSLLVEFEMIAYMDDDFSSNDTFSDSLLIIPIQVENKSPEDSKAIVKQSISLTPNSLNGFGEEIKIVECIATGGNRVGDAVLTYGDGKPIADIAVKTITTDHATVASIRLSKELIGERLVCTNPHYTVLTETTPPIEVTYLHQVSDSVQLLDITTTLTLDCAANVETNGELVFTWSGRLVPQDQKQNSSMELLVYAPNTHRENQRVKCSVKNSGYKRRLDFYYLLTYRPAA